MHAILHGAPTVAGQVRMSIRHTVGFRGGEVSLITHTIGTVIQWADARLQRSA